MPITKIDTAGNNVMSTVTLKVQQIATSNGTTSLTILSSYNIMFTGSLAHTCVLPNATTLHVGQRYEIDNSSTATITVQRNDASRLSVLPPQTTIIVTCTDISTATGVWSVDFNGNSQIRGTTTIATSGTTTQLTVSTPRQFILTGSHTHSIVMPDATTLPFTDWAYEIVNQSTMPVSILAFGGATLTVIPAGFDFNINCTDMSTQAGTWQYITVAQLMSQSAAPPMALNGLDLWGHSYLDLPNVGNSLSNYTTNTNATFGNLLATSLGIPLSQVNNHAVTGSKFTDPVRGGTINNGGGFSKILAEIFKTKMQYYPYGRNGNAHLICTGINDIGNTAAGSQALLRSTAVDIMTTVVSKMRASVVINGTSSGQGLTYTGSWGAASAAAIDYTSGYAWATSTTGNSFTFQIPLGYNGEPITFAMVGYSSANTCTVTWSGTAGITGTTVLASRALNAQSIVPFRVTTLSSAAAGQTIIGTVSLSSQTFILDGVYIEATKPVAVLIANVPRLPCHNISIQSGAGTTTGATTAFTDSIMNFSTRDDAGAVMTEVDAQGAFTGNTNTVASVTNATTIVLGTAATGAKSNIMYTLSRRLNAYVASGYTNTNFTSATIATHTAADVDITNWNSQVVNAVKNLFDSMVQIVDLDAVVGADATCPPSVYSWYDNVTFFHLSDLGSQMGALAAWNAVAKLQQATTDLMPLGPMQNAAAPTYRSAGYRRIILNTPISNTAGGLYLPDGAQLDVVANTYTCVAGDVFAYPILVTESGIFAMGCKLEQVGATGTSTIRVGLYDDAGGPGGPWGYPQCLRVDGGTTVLTASNAVKDLGSFYRPLYPGLWWLTLGVVSIGTASTLRTIYGPSPLLPSWNGTVNGAIRPIAWKVTGQTLTSQMPGYFPTGGVLVGSAGGTFASASSAPLCSIMLNVF